MSDRKYTFEYTVYFNRKQLREIIDIERCQLEGVHFGGLQDHDVAQCPISHFQGQASARIMQQILKKCLEIL
jgi:hypothetical protein